MILKIYRKVKKKVALLILLCITLVFHLYLVNINAGFCSYGVYEDAFGNPIVYDDGLYTRYEPVQSGPNPSHRPVVMGKVTVNNNDIRHYEPTIGIRSDINVENPKGSGLVQVSAPITVGQHDEIPDVLEELILAFNPYQDTGWLAMNGITTNYNDVVVYDPDIYMQKDISITGGPQPVTLETPIGYSTLEYTIDSDSELYGDTLYNREPGLVQDHIVVMGDVTLNYTELGIYEQVIDIVANIAIENTDCGGPVELNVPIDVGLQDKISGDIKVINFQWGNINYIYVILPMNNMTLNYNDNVVYDPDITIKKHTSVTGGSESTVVRTPVEYSPLQYNRYGEADLWY